jgi:hypothetical protein
MAKLCNTLIVWWARQDSNQGPRDYEFLFHMPLHGVQGLPAFGVAIYMKYAGGGTWKGPDDSARGQGAVTRGRAGINGVCVIHT